MRNIKLCVMRVVVIVLAAAFFYNTPRLLAFSQKDVKQVVQDNGCKLLILENHLNPTITVQIFIKGGLLTQDKPSAANFSLSILAGGTKKYSENEYYDKLDAMGAQASFAANPDFSLITVRSLSSSGAAPLEFVLDGLKNPDFSKSKFRQIRERIRKNILRRANYPFNRAADKLWAALFKGEKYEYPVVGTVETLSAVRVKDLKKYYRSLLSPENWVVVISGDVTPGVLKQIEGYLSRYKLFSKAGRGKINYPLNAGAISDTTIILREKQGQDYVLMGMRYKYSDLKDYAGMKLLSKYLGGSAMESRLFMILREKYGISYVATAFFPTRVGPSLLGIYFDALKGAADTGVRAVNEELDAIEEGNIDTRLLSDVRANTRNEFRVSLSNVSKYAWYLGFYEMETGDYKNLYRYPELVQNVPFICRPIC